MDLEFELKGNDYIVHTPCPGCLAPDFWVSPVNKLSELSGVSTKCDNCGRSFAIMLTDIPGPEGVEIVQTGGDSLPEAYYGFYRRVS